MKQLKEVDSELSVNQKELYKLSNVLQFTEICKFKITEEGLLSIPWNNLDHMGVYFLEIRNNNEFNSFTGWIKNFRKEWEHERFKGKFVANLKKKRISQHSELKEWIPLYIGKSKKIGRRIYEHIHLPLEKKTFALKLKAREHIVDQEFRLSIIQINVENYDWILPVIEASLRNKINPIIGRQ